MTAHNKGHINNEQNWEQICDIQTGNILCMVKEYFEAYAHNKDYNNTKQRQLRKISLLPHLYRNILCMVKEYFEAYAHNKDYNNTKQRQLRNI